MKHGSLPGDEVNVLLCEDPSSILHAPLTHCYDRHKRTEIAYFLTHSNKNVGCTEGRCPLYSRKKKMLDGKKCKPQFVPPLFVIMSFQMRVSYDNNFIYVAYKDNNIYGVKVTEIVYRLITHKRPILRNQCRPRCTVRTFNSLHATGHVAIHSREYI